MLSLSKVIALATLAFVTFTQAVPLAERDATGNGARVPDASLPTTNPATLEVALNNLVLQLHTTLAPLRMKSSFSTVCTSLIGFWIDSFEGVTDRVAHVNQVMLGMSVVLKDSVGIVNSLAVKPVGEVLAGTNSVKLTLADTVNLVNTVVVVVFSGLGEAIAAVNDITQLQQILSIIL